MKQTIQEAAMDYMQSHECNFYAEDNNVTLWIGPTAVDVESIWRSKDEDKIYLHVGCKEFEGDIDIDSLSDENQRRMLDAFGIDTRREKKYSQKEMENAVMLAGDMYQRLYNAASTPGGSLEVANVIIDEGVKMEKWLVEKYGPDDEEYLDRLDEYEAMLEKEYGLDEKSDGYTNDSQGKLEWLLNTHYNLFHADMISRALHDDSVTIQDFIHGCVGIAMAERDTDDDEFTPKEFENV